MKKLNKTHFYVGFECTFMILGEILKNKAIIFFFNFDCKGPPLQYEGKIIVSESITDLNNINVH